MRKKKEKKKKNSKNSIDKNCFLTFKPTIHRLPTGFSRKNGFRRAGIDGTRRGVQGGVTLFREMEFPREFG